MTPEDRLIEAVEGMTIAPDSFGHEAHVRLAFAYLQRHDLFEALARCRRALRGLAEHLGAADKYHETVTCALVFLIHERMQAVRAAGRQEEPAVREPGLRGGEHGEAVEWEAFAAANPDLLRWKEGAFFDYYPDEVLASDLARRTFVMPHPAPGVRWPSRAAPDRGAMAHGAAAGSGS